MFQKLKNWWNKPVKEFNNKPKEIDSNKSFSANLNETYWFVYRVLGDYLPSTLAQNRNQLDFLLRTYPILRFMCEELQANEMSKRTLTVEDVLETYQSFDYPKIISLIKKWQHKTATEIATAYVVKSGIEDSTVSRYQVRFNHFYSKLIGNQNLIKKLIEAYPKSVPVYIQESLMTDKEFDALLATKSTTQHAD